MCDFLREGQQFSANGWVVGRRVEVGYSGNLMFADIGDWIIKVADGVFHTCKPDIFEATYEKVV